MKPDTKNQYHIYFFPLFYTIYSVSVTGIYLLLSSADVLPSDDMPATSGETAMSSAADEPSLSFLATEIRAVRMSTQNIAKDTKEIKTTVEDIERKISTLEEPVAAWKAPLRHPSSTPKLSRRKYTFRSALKIWIIADDAAISKS